MTPPLLTTRPIPVPTQRNGAAGKEVFPKALGMRRVADAGDESGDEPEPADACPEGTHQIVREHRPSGKRGMLVCRNCPTYQQGIYDQPDPGAAAGDYRVVCREPGCDYGHRVDADGHGYSNHAALCMAVSALQRHQESADDQHAAQIEQHPVDAVVSAA